MSAFEPRPDNVYVDFICPWPNRTKIGSFNHEQMRQGFVGSMRERNRFWQRSCVGGQ